MRKLIRSGILLMALFVAACASSAPMHPLQSPAPQLSADKGRIFFYRDDSAFGRSLQPAINLNGQKTGYTIPGTAFFRDVTPGHYLVECTTEVTRSAAFDLTAGQTKYIRTRPTWGAMEGHIQVEPIDPKEAELAIQKLVLITGSD